MSPLYNLFGLTLKWHQMFLLRPKYLHPWWDPLGYFVFWVWTGEILPHTGNCFLTSPKNLIIVEFRCLTTIFQNFWIWHSVFIPAFFEYELGKFLLTQGTVSRTHLKISKLIIFPLLIWPNVLVSSHLNGIANLERLQKCT